jgi:hypothetical protein
MIYKQINGTINPTFNIGSGLTSAQRIALPTPKIGTLVYDTDTDCHWWWDGALWQKFASASLPVGYHYTVDTIANLKAINTTGMPSGQIIYLDELDDFYSLDLISAYVPDDIGVIDPNTGPGQWVGYARGRWDDILGSISQGVGSSVLTYEPWFSVPFRQYWFQHNQLDELNFVYQMSHGWDSTSRVYPHLHIKIAANPAVLQYIYIDGWYCWGLNEQTVPTTTAGWLPISVQYPVNPGDIYKCKIINLVAGGVAPPVGATGSSLLYIYMRRATTNPLDTFKTNKAVPTVQANVALDSSDVHWRRRDFGTVNQYPP